MVSDAADQGVAITGNQTFNNWNWPNAMIFAATVITTIGRSLYTFSTPRSTSSPLNLTGMAPMGRAVQVRQMLTAQSSRMLWLRGLSIFTLSGLAGFS